MTFTETAAAFRRLADGIDKVIRAQGADTDTGVAKAMLREDAAVGAAVMLTYIRDLATQANRDSWDRPSLLVMLECISRDAELFPCGTGVAIWNAEEEE